MAEFCVGDAQALPYPDGSFDVAVMALVIHFVPDAAKAVAEMARVVRPGGLAASYVWDYGAKGAPTAPVSAALRSLGFEPASPPSAHQTSMEALQELWRNAGLEAIETRAIKIAVEHPDFDEYWSSVSVPVGPAGAVIKRMSTAERQELRARLRERSMIAPDGRVAFEALANAIKGRVPT
jgi:SAM-dependent methyltransferase